MSQPFDARPYDPQRGPWPAPPQKTSTTGPMIMTIVGIVLAVIALVLVIAGIVRFADTVSEDALEMRHGDRDGVQVRADIPEPAAFTAEEGTTYAVLFFGSPQDEVDVDDLTVTGPRGEDVDLVASHVSYSTSSSRTTTYLATFEADDAGTYTLTVDGPSAGVDGELAVTDDELVVDLVLGAVSGVLLLVAGLITGATGLGLAIGGAVWWTVRRRAARALTR